MEAMLNNDRQKASGRHGFAWWHWAIVCVAGVLVGVAFYLWLSDEEVPDASSARHASSANGDVSRGGAYRTYAELAERGVKRTASDGSVRTGAAVPGEDVPFEIEKGYYDEDKGRILNPNDCDGDGLPDDWEMETFGDLLQNRKTWVATKEKLDAARRPAGSDDPNDTDADTLDDEWERKHFGDLSQGPNDDPDADGYYNYVEMTSQQRGQSKFDPNQPNLADVKYRPQTLPPARPAEADTRPTGRRLPWSIRSREFWLKQDAVGRGSGEAQTPGQPAGSSDAERQAAASDQTPAR
jgi:hypothetical protein